MLLLCGEGVFVWGHAAAFSSRTHAQHCRVLSQFFLVKGSGVWPKILVNTGISIPRLSTYSSNHHILKKDFSFIWLVICSPTGCTVSQPYKKCGDGVSLLSMGHTHTSVVSHHLPWFPSLGVTCRAHALRDCQVLTYSHVRATCLWRVIHVRTAGDHYPYLNRGSGVLLYGHWMCICVCPCMWGMRWGSHA